VAGNSERGGRREVDGEKGRENGLPLGRILRARDRA